MANDASITRVEELARMAKFFQDFSLAMSKNGTSLVNVMMQKLEEMRKKKKRAEALMMQADKEYYSILNEFASTPSEDYERQSQLRLQVQEAKHKLDDARKMCETVSLNVNVAQGMVRCMVDNTKVFQNKLASSVEEGVNLLRKSAMELQQYNDAKHSI